MESEEQIAERRRKMVSVTKLGATAFFCFVFAMQPPSKRAKIKIKLSPVALGVDFTIVC